jgi:DNA polymerase-3 subunit beta
MEFTVAKADLVRELSLSQGVVEKKTTIPILSNVLLEATGEQLVLTATDLELGIRCSCPAQIKKEGSGTLPAKKLLDYVRLLPDAAVSMKFLDNHWVSLTCNRSRTRMAGMSRESFPALPSMPELISEIPVKILTSMISRTGFAITVEESRFTLNGALLLIRPNGFVMVATDGHRLSYAEEPFELSSLAKVYRALVPKKAMAEIMKLAQETDSEAMVQFSADDNHLFFQFGQRLLITRRLTGNFPDFERVLPKEHSHEVTVNREELRGSIERVAQFADERSRAIRVQFVENELKLFSSSADTGESEEAIPITYEGPDTSVCFNAQYLLDFLRVVSEESVVVEFKDSKNAGEFHPGGESRKLGYRYVVMPMRI